MTDTATTLTVRHLDVSDPAALFRQYPNQSEHQPTYIELDLANGLLLADWNGEIGNAQPATVHHGIDRRYDIPVLTAEAANRLLDELAPIAQRVLDGAEIEWDGNNNVAVLTEAALDAEQEIEKRLGYTVGTYTEGRETYRFSTPPTDLDEVYADEDIVCIWDLDGAVNGEEADHHGITADTTDERLAEIAEEIASDLASCNDHKVAVVPGLDGYLAQLRDEAANTND